MTEKLKAFKA